MTYKTSMIILPLFLAFVAFGKNMISAEETQRCPAFASQRSIYGMMLKGHVYKTEMAGIGLECVLMCRTDDRCQSFNFVISRHLCEFNDRTKEARPKDFVADPDRYYYTKDINRVPLGSISDLAAESCKEIKASEPQVTSGKFWLSTIKRGMVLQANCDMKTFDVDECSASSPVCDKNGICNNTVGSYNCTCKQGYSSAEGKRCKDIDECQISPPCHVNATCRNSDGSYSCSCNYGLEGDGKTCKENLTLSSAILNKVQGKYLEQLKTFLHPVLQNAPPVKFVRCWRAQTDGWAAATFHNNCDGKGPTVTVIQVGAYIFGGYTDKSWSALPQPQQGSQPEDDETPQGETAAMKLTKSKPYVYFKQKSPISKYLSDTKPLDLSFKAKGLQPIKIQWKKDNLELMIGSRYKTFDSGRQLLVQAPFTKLDTGTYGVSACNFKGCSVKGVQVLFRENHTHDEHVKYGSNEEQKEPITVKDFVEKYGFLGIPSVLVIILIIAIACATGRSKR